MCMQVRAVADLLPPMEVVEGDPFNSSPTDPKMMGPDALARFRAGEKLPAVTAKTPLVRPSTHLKTLCRLTDSAHKDSSAYCLSTGVLHHKLVPAAPNASPVVMRPAMAFNPSRQPIQILDTALSLSLLSRHCERPAWQL
jgi:hypothetical protein